MSPANRGSKRSRIRFPSPVVERFISPAPPCGTFFLKEVVPPEWRPELVYADGRISVELDVQESSCIFMKLHHFDLFRRIADMPFGSPDAMEAIVEVGRQLSRWMREMKGVSVEELPVGAGGAESLGNGHWMFRYSVGKVKGVFSIWITAAFDLTANMTAEIYERVDLHNRGTR